MTEERALSVVESRGMVVSPLDALATMSDAEFAARLAGLKKSQERMEVIQREIMRADVDYGVIPGTGSKPTLLKPGAEKLCKFWHLVPIFKQETIIGDGATAPQIRILSTCSLHLETEDGPIVAQGIGSANSWEKKYRYRDGQRRCPSCGAATIYRSKFPNSRTGKKGWYCFDKKGGCGVEYSDDDKSITDQQLGQIENPDPYDAENTLEKMSAKRAQVDATLRATATSGLFTQDVEDLDTGATVTTAEQPKPKPAQQPTVSKPTAAPVASPDLLCGICHGNIYPTKRMTAVQVAEATHQAMVKLAESDPTITPVQSCQNCYELWKIEYDAKKVAAESQLIREETDAPQELMEI